MSEYERKVMTPGEELVDILLDLIIVSANLVKKVNHSVMEGGNGNGKTQRIGTGNQGPAQRRSHY